jgi:hypothetical protein
MQVFVATLNEKCRERKLLSFDGELFIETNNLRQLFCGQAR